MIISLLRKQKVPPGGKPFALYALFCFSRRLRIFSIGKHTGFLNMLDLPLNLCLDLLHPFIKCHSVKQATVPLIIPAKVQRMVV